MVEFTKTDAKHNEKERFPSPTIKILCLLLYNPN